MVAAVGGAVAVVAVAAGAAIQKCSSLGQHTKHKAAAAGTTHMQ